MKCPDVERVVPEFLEGAPDGPFRSGDAALQADFEAHLKSCRACADLVSDLKLISSEARQLAATEEPSPRLWLRIAAQLRAEGLIRDPEIRERIVRAHPAHRFPSPNFSTTAMERVVAGASCSCGAGGGLLRRKPQATSARGRTASSCASGSFPGEGDVARSRNRYGSLAFSARSGSSATGAKSATKANGRTGAERGRSTVSERSFHAGPLDAGHV